MTEAFREIPLLASPLHICENQDMSDDNYNVHIRPATEADASLVFELIRKLAEYGDISDEVSATEQNVRAALFGPRPVAEAILAFVGSEPAGFALYSYTFASFLGRPGIYIEDLFVEQAHRGA